MGEGLAALAQDPPPTLLHCARGAGPSQSHQPHPRRGDPASRGQGLELLHSVSDVHSTSRGARPDSTRTGKRRREASGLASGAALGGHGGEIANAAARPNPPLSGFSHGGWGAVRGQQSF